MMGRQVRPPDPWDAVVSVTNEELETAEFNVPRYEIRKDGIRGESRYSVFLVDPKRGDAYIQACETIRGGKRIIRRHRKNRFQERQAIVVYSEEA